MRARVLLDHEAVANGVGQTVHAMVEVAAGAPVVDRSRATGPDWAVRVRVRCVDINHWFW